MSPIPKETLLNYRNGISMIICREIKFEDIPQVVGLIKQLGYNVTIGDLETRLKEIISHGKGTVFVAENDEQKIVGCVHAMIDTRFAGGTFGEIGSLVTDESVRGQGIGKRLIEESTKWLKAKGQTRLRVRCNSIRHETHNFYNHLGFTEKKSAKL